MPSLGLVSGIILVLLFYSLLATIIMEFVSGLISMRGKHLEKILQGLLSSSDRREEILNDFKSNPLYKNKQLLRLPDTQYNGFTRQENPLNLPTGYGNFMSLHHRPPSLEVPIQKRPTEFDSD